MGFSQSFIAGVINRDGPALQADYDVWLFRHGDGAHITWCGPQKRPPRDNELDLAAGTLRVRLPPATETLDRLSYSGREIGVTAPDQFNYSERFGYNSDVHSTLIHLALPPHHLPLIETLTPPPDTGWRYDDRFVLIWTDVATDRVAFALKAVAPDTFLAQAAEIATQIAARPVAAADEAAPVVTVDVPDQLVARVDPERQRSLCRIEIMFEVKNGLNGGERPIVLTSELWQLAPPTYSRRLLQPGESWLETQRITLGRDQIRAVRDGHRLAVHTRATYGGLRLDPRVCHEQVSDLPAIEGVDETWWQQGVVAILGGAKTGRRVQGAGFLVADRIIATCAHVVADVLGAAAGVGAEVAVRFEATGTIATSNISVYRNREAEDVALLALSEGPPAAVRALPLDLSANIGGNEVQSLGYPRAGGFDRLPGRGTVTGFTTENAGRLARLTLSSSEITNGFSGAPVWDVRRERALGMITKGLLPDKAGRLGQVAVAVPAQTLRDLLL